MENDLTYDIDIGKILTKLHIAAVKSLLKHKVKYYNSGIVNMDNSATLEDTKEVNFDISNSSGIYELGVLFEEAVINLPHSVDDFGKPGVNTEKFNRENTRAYEAEIEKFKKLAYQHIKNYFTVFAGYMVADKIKIRDLEQISLSNDCLDPEKITSYVDFEIPKIGSIRDNIQYARQRQQMSKNSSSHKLILNNLAFKVNYQIYNKNM